MRRHQFEAYLDKVLDWTAQAATMAKGGDGVLRSDWARGRVVAAVDGIGICSSYCRCCEAGLERSVAPKVDGKLEEWTQYHHRLSAVPVASTPFPILWESDFRNPAKRKWTGRLPSCHLKQPSVHPSRALVVPTMV